MGKLECIQTMKKHVGRVWHVSWNPKGDMLASCGEDKTIRLWSSSNIASLTGSGWVNKVVLAEGHKRTIREVSWSPCGKYLASASFDATTCIWDNKSGQFECNATLEGHENEVKSVSWSKSGHLLATCSRDKSVWIWEVADDDEYDCAAVLNAHTQDVKKVLWNPKIDLLASASYDSTIKLFKEDTLDTDWISCGLLKGHESTVWSLAWNKDGDRLASCSDDCTVKIWQKYEPGNSENIETKNGEPTWKCVCTLSGHHHRTIYDISWCHLTGMIATACGDDGIRIFKEDEGCDRNQPTYSLIAFVERAHTQDVNSVAWNPTQPGLLASCSDDAEIKLWKFVE